MQAIQVPPPRPRRIPAVHVRVRTTTVPLGIAKPVKEDVCKEPIFFCVAHKPCYTFAVWFYPDADADVVAIIDDTLLHLQLLKLLVLFPYSLPIR
jgi:hypothetical protein